MEPQERPEADPEPDRSWPTGADVLRDLEARLERASEAAERLLADATASAGRAGRSPRTEADAAPAAAATGSPPPPASEDVPPASDGVPPAAGWQTAGSGAPDTGRELELLMGVLGTLRDLVPPELQQRLAEAVRELLLAVRALIDWYLERAERRRAQPSEVEDIPIQ